MSFSRSARFPLLKLPWLCIESVITNWNVVDLIFFAQISKKNRRIVKSFRILLNRIQISISEKGTIWLGGFSEIWNFRKPSFQPSLDHNSKKIPLKLRNNSIPLYTSRTNDDLTSYTYGNAIDVLKLAMEFLNEVFNCSVEAVHIDGNYFPESMNLKLNLLLKNLHVTGTCVFLMENTKSGFYVNPKLLKCKQLVFSSGSAAWVTREILLQFEVPRLTFLRCPFSVEDILSFVTNWFQSNQTKLEYFDILYQDGQISLENFQTKELNPVPFSVRNRVPLSESFRDIDFSKGLEIVRHDGLVATIHVTRRAFLFYIWHVQPAITQN